MRFAATDPLRGRTMIDVTIIGAGITGASAAFHLQKRGITNISHISRGTPKISGLRSRPIPALGGMADNITRIEAARGGEVADAVWRFGDRALAALTTHCREWGVTLATGDHIRAATAPMESRELAIAIDSLQRKGAPVRKGMLHDVAPGASLDYPTQIESGKSAAIAGEGLLHSLMGKVSPGDVSRIVPEHGHVTIWIDDKSFQSQFVILAAHQNIAAIFPEARDWLVPYADEVHWVRGKFHPPSFPVGSTLTWNFGYNGLTRLNDDLYALRGARFLRRDGGVGQTVAILQEGVLPKLLNDVEMFFPGLVDPKPEGSLPFVEIRPCDELPLIGPAPGTERVLLATGYMGHGFSLGFLAGKCLADLVLNGMSSDLPEIFLPRRLRTMDGTS